MVSRGGVRSGRALWIDAHGDLNRPNTSPSGNVHGMPLAAALGRVMDTYVIRRPNGWGSPEELEAAAARSKQVGDEAMSDDIRWIRSYVVDETTAASAPSAATRRRAREDP